MSTESVPGLPFSPTTGTSTSPPPNVLETILGFMLPDGDFLQALNAALTSGALLPEDVDLFQFATLIDTLPPGDLRMLADQPTLPAPMREALNQLGLANNAPAPAEAPAAQAAAAQANAASANNGNANLGIAAQAGPTQASQVPGGDRVNVSNQASSQSTAQTANASTLASATAAAAVVIPTTARVADAAFAARADAGLANAAAADIGAIRQPIPGAVTAVAIPDRADAPAVQAPAAQAQAQVPAAPQGSVVMPSLAPARGREANAAGAPPPPNAAGHTAAVAGRGAGGSGASSKAARQGAQGNPLLTGLPRLRAEGEEENTSSQWLFWVLTIVAYAAVAVALGSMALNGGGLSEGVSRPNVAGYALIAGVLAGIGAWLLGRKLAKR